MILYILLLLLFFVVLLLTVVEQRKASKELKKQLQELSELNEVWTQHELLQLKNIDLNEADLKLSNPTSELLSSTQQEAYERYLKRGGTDSYPTWIQKSDMHELFP